MREKLEGEISPEDGLANNSFDDLIAAIKIKYEKGENLSSWQIENLHKLVSELENAAAKDKTGDLPLESREKIQEIVVLINQIDAAKYDEKLYRTLVDKLYDYHPARIGIMNAVERRRDKNIQPVFSTASTGEYNSFEIKSENDTCFIVTPRQGSIYFGVMHEYGGGKELFDVKNYDPEKEHTARWHSIRLIKPARVEKRGEKIMIIEKGEIELGAEKK